jgi:hypothetical protein
MKELLINLINVVGLAWWVEIITASPRCTYYFGPFLTAKEAEEAQDGYLQDLEEEGALGIRVEIKRCKPTELTISDELGKMGELGVWPAFSGLP